MWQVWGKGEVHTRFLWGNLRKRDCLDNIGIDDVIIVKHIFMEQDGSSRLD
jgi:hypothetical protein